METSGTGTATIASGDSLKMLGGLGGTGTLAVNTRNNAGALTLGGDVSGFSGTLNLSGANLYLNADTPLAGTLNASTAKVTALRKQNVTGTLNAASELGRSDADGEQPGAGRGCRRQPGH